MKYDDKGNFAEVSDRELVRTGRRWAIWTIVAVVAASILIPIGIWGFNVATSNTKGQGDAAIIKNSATNRIEAQAQYHANFESIRSLDQRLTDAGATLAAFNKQHPLVGNGTAYDPLIEQQTNLQTTVTGLQQQCRRVVGEYNASTEQYTARDFRDADLPYKIVASDPAFTNGGASFADFDCLASK